MHFIKHIAASLVTHCVEAKK